ncbi:MAG: cytochrome c family protein [Caulobacteraceae bacterium]|nr:cytochrome c family protein [Caulobacteraceae bacterium]
MHNFTFVSGILGLLALTGCAGLSPASDVRRPAAWARGQFYVSRSCAGCHAVTDQGDSPNPRAPVFRTLSLRFDTAHLEAALTAISRHGHEEMPPIYISPAEIKDIAGYIESLKPPSIWPGTGSARDAWVLTRLAPNTPPDREHVVLAPGGRRSCISDPWPTTRRVSETSG